MKFLRLARVRQQKQLREKMLQNVTDTKHVHFYSMADDCLHPILVY